MSGIGCFPFMHGLHNGCSWSTRPNARTSPALRLKTLLWRATNQEHSDSTASLKMKHLRHTPLLAAAAVACFTMCADGGTNRLYDSLPGMLGAQISEAKAVRRRFLPHAIVGDLDSIRP